MQNVMRQTMLKYFSSIKTYSKKTSSAEQWHNMTALPCHCMGGGRTCWPPAPGDANLSNATAREHFLVFYSHLQHPWPS